MINLNEFNNDPQPPQEVYNISNGYCEDLPGYLIGTTPILFNPEAEPYENPFFTDEPFTGQLIYYGETMASNEEECCPEIEIRQGIGIGVTAIIRNPYNETFTDLKWSMVIDGMVFLGGEKNGVISSLEPGEEVTIKSGLVIGFGSAVITVTVDDYDPVIKDATLLFIFVNVK